jgi:hypothetical protein
MNAGSSPDTGKSGIKGFVIPITEPPVVEIDTEATAAYIRLRDTKVVTTKPFGSNKGLVMLDFVRTKMLWVLKWSVSTSSASANS